MSRVNTVASSSLATSTSSDWTATYTTTTTVAPTACSAIRNLHQVYVQPKGDADIAGFGVSRPLPRRSPKSHLLADTPASVILAFVLSAGLVLVAALASYWLGLLHKDLLNVADEKIYRARSTDSSPGQETVVKFVLIFSDQQIVTGIAILVAGYAQWNRIDVYHW